MPTLTSQELLALIAVARLGEAAYGVAVRREIRECSGRSLSIPAVYAALARLEDLHMIRPWMSEARPERGGRARRHYSLLAAGRRHLEHERAVATRMWSGVPQRGGRS